MKICDRCKGTPISTIMIDARTEEEVDLCVKCTDDFHGWRTGKKPDPGAGTLADIPKDDLKTKVRPKAK